MESTECILIDFEHEGFEKIIKVTQFDTGKIVRCHIKGISGDVGLAMVYCRKPSGLETYTSADVVDDHTVEFAITKQMNAEIGEVKCQLQLFGDDKSLTSYPFKILVRENMIADSRVTSTDEYTAFIDTVSKLTGAHSELSDKIESEKVERVSADAAEKADRVSADEAEKSERQAADAAEKAERMQEIAVERARINNLVANNNPTEGNSELLDIRVGVDGTDYGSAGDAVRGQIGSLSENIDYYKGSNLINMLDRRTCIIGKGYSGTTNTFVDSTGLILSDYIPCVRGDVLTGILRDIELYEAITEYNMCKVGIYNSYKEWIKTVDIKNSVVEQYVFDTSGYFRFNFGIYGSEESTLDMFIQDDRNFSVFLSSKRYLNGEKICQNNNKYDVFIFAGQSNMAGRGSAVKAPSVIDGAGYEYKAISNPNILSKIYEPFGVDENKEDGIDDGNSKTGSMVSSFVNEYFSITKTPIIAISASEGGTSISEWETILVNDAISRLESCLKFMKLNDYNINTVNLLWCQGETDADQGTLKENYIQSLTNVFNAFRTSGVENIFMVRIGEYNGTEEVDYSDMIEWQTEYTQTKDVVMATTTLSSMKNRGLMKDDFHYTQEAYNEAGAYSGQNCAFYIITKKEPTMYDSKYNDLYFAQKN